MSHDDGLSDAISDMDMKIVFCGIKEDDHDFASVVGVDGAWCVQDGDAVFKGEPASWSDFDMAVLGGGDGQSRVDECAATGWDCDIFGAFEIVTGGFFCAACGDFSVGIEFDNPAVCVLKRL